MSFLLISREGFFMFSSVVSGAVYGVHSYLMHIETDISDGLPMFTMVGFVSAQVREAGERVRVAMRNTGIHLPPKRITVNLTPAEIPKRDVIADLPVAIGILIAMGLLDQKAVKDVFIAGGLSLDGVVTPVRGVLPMVLEAKERGMKVFLLPRENVKEGAAVHGIHAVGVTTLEEVFHYLRLPKGERNSFLPPEPEKMLSYETAEKQERMDLSDVCGQDGVKRALEIAAAGFHNVLMIGPPGSGKSMMARCLPGILPELTYEESLEISSVYSIAGELPEGASLIRERPFVAPHHSITQQALVGGGNYPRPGAISLAHRGVLFLDELPEFGRESLNLLRQPLEDQRIVIARNSGTYEFPAKFMLVCAANPCPCGFYPEDRCHCTQAQIQNYQNRIPGPILDRIDLCTDAPRVPVGELLSRKAQEKSEDVRRRVIAAQERQAYRFREEAILFNGEMNAAQTEKYCILGRSEKKFVKEVFRRMDLSARAFHRILRVSRTIADLEGEERILEDHLAEAVGYRSADRRAPE